MEWVAISFSRGSSWSGDETCISCTGTWVLYHWVTRCWWVNINPTFQFHYFVCSTDFLCSLVLRDQFCWRSLFSWSLMWRDWFISLFPPLEWYHWTYYTVLFILISLLHWFSTKDFMVSLLFLVVFLWKVILMTIPWDWLTANLHNAWMKAFYSFYLKSRLSFFLFPFFLLSPFLPFSLFPFPLSFPELLYSTSALGNIIQFLTKGSGKIFEDTELWNQGPIPTPINLKKIR